MPAEPSAPSVPAAVAVPSTSASALKRYRRSRPTTAPRADSMQVMIRQQTRQLQLERQRLRVQEQKLSSLAGIHAELTALRTAVYQHLGLELVPASAVEE